MELSSSPQMMAAMDWSLGHSPPTCCITSRCPRRTDRLHHERCPRSLPERHGPSSGGIRRAVHLLSWGLGLGQSDESVLAPTDGSLELGRVQRAVGLGEGFLDLPGDVLDLQNPPERRAGDVVALGYLRALSDLGHQLHLGLEEVDVAAEVGVELAQAGQLL